MQVNFKDSENHGKRGSDEDEKWRCRGIGRSQMLGYSSEGGPVK